MAVLRGCVDGSLCLSLEPSLNATVALLDGSREAQRGCLWQADEDLFLIRSLCHLISPMVHRWALLIISWVSPVMEGALSRMAGATFAWA